MITQKQMCMEAITGLISQYGIRFTINYFESYGYMMGLNARREKGKIILQDKYNAKNKITFSYHKLNSAKLGRSMS